MTHAFETSQNENITLRKRLADTQALLQTRKSQEKGRRVALQGQSIFRTKEVLEIAKKAELVTAQTKTHKRLRKQAAAISLEDGDEKVPEIASNDCESDCVVVSTTRSS